MSEDKRKNNPKLRYETLRRNLEAASVRKDRELDFSLRIHSVCEWPGLSVGEVSFKLVAALAALPQLYDDFLIGLQSPKLADLL